MMIQASHIQPAYSTTPQACGAKRNSAGSAAVRTDLRSGDGAHSCCIRIIPSEFINRQKRADNL